MQSIQFEQYSKYLEWDKNGNLALPNIKRIFIPDEGMELFDGDLSGADIQVVAADSQCKWLLDFFSKPQSKKVYAYIASEYFQRDISDKSDEYKLYKGVFHGCITGEHEVLTHEGWVRIDQYDENLPLMVWNPKDYSTYFEIPKGLNKDYVEPEEKLLSISGTSFNQLTTIDHKFIYRSNEKDTICEGRYLPKAARLPYIGYYKGGILKYDPNLIRLIVALQADGTIAHTANNGDVTYAFRFARQRKIDRLRELLTKLSIPYSESCTDETTAGNPVTSFRFKNVLKPEWKKLDWYVLDWDKENLEIFVDELQYWDGCNRINNGIRTSIATTDKKAMEILQTIIQLSGKGSKVIHKERDSTRKDIYEISINNRKYFNLGSGVKKFISHKGTKVYCPQTSTGFFMVRHKGHVMVTGNTNYLLGITKLASMAGISEELAKGLQNFYFHLNPEIQQWHIRLQKEVRTRGYIVNAFGRRMWFLNKNNPNLMNEVAAGIPQSTIGDVINRAWVKTRKELPELRPILMQTHDSLTGQYPIFASERHKVRQTHFTTQYSEEESESYRVRIPKLMEIAIPYDPPLYIPADIKVSTVSYGDTEKVKH